MICGARSASHGFRWETWAEGRERREDTADYRPAHKPGVCAAVAASADHDTVSARSASASRRETSGVARRLRPTFATMMASSLNP
jgi:hypothetical protein